MATSPHEIEKIGKDVQSAIESYLEIAGSGDGDETARIAKLKASLDALAVLSHRIPEVSGPAECPQPPPRDASAVWERTARNFPSLGFYELSFGRERQGPGALLSVSAVEDVAEIAGELEDILWRLRNTSPADALFHFKVTFQSHWGLHLRCLQVYLHDL